MTLGNNVTTRATVAAVALLAATALGAAAAHADEVNLKGNANGTFGNGGTTLGGLSYTASTFDATSSGGFIGFGGDNGNFNNFGTMTLDSQPFNYAGNSFTLDLLFTAPTGISGGQGGTYAAKLLGQVGNNSTGGIFIDFDDAPQVFNFSGASGSGSFTLFVNNLSINPGLTASVTGTVIGANQTAIPEPGTLALLGAGLLPFAGVVARRRAKLA